MKDTHDKKWIVETKTDLITIFKTGDKVESFGYIPIENTLLDQIRRDAKKEAYSELLDEIENLFVDNELVNEDALAWFSIDYDEWKKLRAKTLGEK